jgi:hypothetical protein
MGAGNPFVCYDPNGFHCRMAWARRRERIYGQRGTDTVLRYKNFPVSLEGGSSSALISAHEFGDLDLGDTFQFTTHAGLNWDITRRWRLGYRYQHTSNAVLANHNPGLNLHSFGLSYVF